MTQSHPLVELARSAIEVYIRQGRKIDAPGQPTREMQQKAGAFVSLHRHGQLRGCIGTIQPRCRNVAEEVIENAISAATFDPRFEPVCSEELEGLEIKVDVLKEPEAIDSEDQLDPQRYGLIVQSLTRPSRRGLLLPNLDGIDTVEKQVYWTRYHKAGITNPEEPVQMFRFEVMRYS
jgi:AmmeMemoRadiSam system protein A